MKGALTMLAMSELKKKAKTVNLQPGSMDKTNLIRAIQKAEGNFPCFKTAQGSCDQLGCCWREDCLGCKSN
jgi:hypothetical protein